MPFDGNDPSGRWGTQDAMNDPTRFRQGGFVQVPPSYFDAMRVKLVAGRIFTQAENDDPNTKISRPRQIYVGPTNTHYVPIDQRP